MYLYKYLNGKVWTVLCCKGYIGIRVCNDSSLVFRETRNLLDFGIVLHKYHANLLQSQGTVKPLLLHSWVTLKTCLR